MNVKSFISLIILTFTLFLPGCINFDSYSITITYELSISVNHADNYSIIVPCFNNDKIKSQIKITKGIGDFSFIHSNLSEVTDNNHGIMVNSSGNISLHGECSWNYNGNKHTDEVLSLKKSWNEYWVWCNKNESQSISINIYGRFETYTDGEEWVTENEIFLLNGWNLIEIDESAWES